MICAFFGHRDTPQEIKQQLKQTVQQLIKDNNDITFYVGTSGAFDRMVKAVLCELSEIYPHMQYYVILAYLSNSKENPYKNVLTIYPEGIENVPKQFAINFRNDFMVKNCDMVVCYIKHDWGGAAQFVKKAKNKGRKIINIAVAEK